MSTVQHPRESTPCLADETIARVITLRSDSRQTETPETILPSCTAIGSPCRLSGPVKVLRGASGGAPSWWTGRLL